MLAARRVAADALPLLPAALVLYFAFNSGGFYPGACAYVAAGLCVVLAVRVALGAAPLSGLSVGLAVAAGALSIYALLTLASGSWSHAPGVARVEFDLPLVYVLVLVVCGSIAHTAARMRWMVRGLAGATVVICTCGLITRVLPHWWPTAPEVVNNRLSFPVTYWNVLGLVAAVGIVLCVHLTGDLRERRGVRVGAAAAVPALAATLFFTFSRGAIAVAVIALVAYALIGRPRGLVSAVLACAPATAVALKLSYDANLLATLNPTTPAAVAQGSHLALVLADCVLGAAVIRIALALTLDRALGQLRWWPRWQRQAARAGWLLLAVVALGTVIALSGTIAAKYHRFLSPAGPGSGHDLRARLTDPANDGRVELWRVAWHGFQSAPALGHGAGSFANTWAHHRPDTHVVHDAHSLYLETLDELGIVGLALLLVVVVGILVRVASRARGPDRPVYAAAFAALLAWAVHAGVDWDWEMPVATVIFFSLGGLALARDREAPADVSRAAGAAPAGRPPPAAGAVRWVAARVAPALALLALALLPVFVWISQARLDDASYLFARDDYVSARSAAMSSLSALGNRSEPYQIIGYCDLRLGMPRAGVAAMAKAVSLDPGNGTYVYGLALATAAAGRDPRPAAASAVSLNPHDGLARWAWFVFKSSPRSRWAAEGKAMARKITRL